jgi:hypothetical protein
MQLSRFLSIRPLHSLGAQDAAPAPQPRFWLTVLLLTLAFGASGYHLLFSKALVELELETDTRTLLKLYWPNPQGCYSEHQRVSLQIKPGKTRYTAFVTDLSKIDRLRLDPSENHAAKITIRRLHIRQAGFFPLLLTSKADFAGLKVVAGVEAAVRPEEGGISLDIRDKDPQLELLLPKIKQDILWRDALGAGAGVVLLALALACIGRAVLHGFSFAPVLAVAALTLIIVMAGISGFNTHPDESVHLSAAEYYQEHSLPPRADDPAIARTCSVYGVSRLHNGEMYYWLAGKTLWLLQPLRLEPYLTLRLLNALLFLGLTIFVFRQAEFRVFLLPLLISPQIWYVFTYVDSDAFALFISTAAAWQLAAEQSAFNRLLRGQPGKSGWIAALLLGLLLALLLLAKKNFYFAAMFFGCVFLWRLWLVRPVWTKNAAFRLAALLMVGGSLALTWRLTDAWVNNFRKSELILAAKEKYAGTAYKPSTPLAKKHPYLYMRERGASLKKLLTVDRWGEKTFRSSFGVFGYTQYSAPPLYYSLVRAVSLLLLLTLLLPLLLRGGLPGLILVSIFGCCALSLAGMMLYKSWTTDFQTQGRYLLPILPMLSVLCCHGERVVPPLLFRSLLFLLFGLSVYNFVFVGLLEIGRAVSL